MIKRIRFLSIIAFGILLIGSSLFAGQFTRDEYEARRGRLMEKIPDGEVIILGAKARVDYNEYYQNNDFMYFTGVEVPDAILIIDGVRKESILFYTISERGARNHGISLDYVQKPSDVTGIEKIYPRENFSSYLNRLADGSHVFYTSFKPEELMRECSREKLRTLQNNMVFANEPLCVFPDENLGVRVEDTILITEDGCKNLTAGIPRTVKEIEAQMKKPGIIY